MWPLITGWFLLSFVLGPYWSIDTLCWKDPANYNTVVKRLKCRTSKTNTETHNTCQGRYGTYSWEFALIHLLCAEWLKPHTNALYQENCIWRGQQRLKSTFLRNYLSKIFSGRYDRLNTVSYMEISKHMSTG